MISAIPELPLGLILAIAGGVALLWLLASAAFLLWGARLAGIPRRSFGRALATIFLGGIASTLLSLFLGTAPLIGTGAGLLLGFCVSALVMMAVFKTTFGKALVANLLAWILPFVLIIGLALLGFALFGIRFALA